MNDTVHSLQLASFRVDWHYVTWYKNLASFLATILVPLALLLYWNWSTYAVIKRRNRMKSRCVKIGT